VEEACRILAGEPGAAVLAGGTDLMVHLRQSWRGQRPAAVVNVKRIPGLDAIAVADGAIRLGALASLTALIEHPVIRAEYPVLPATARYMGSPAIRNLATVGGNLCNASPAADLPPVLLALDAEAGIAGPGGPRRLPLERFFRGPGQTVLPPGELLVWVVFRGGAAADPPERLTSAGRWTSRCGRRVVVRRDRPEPGTPASRCARWRPRRSASEAEAALATEGDGRRDRAGGRAGERRCPADQRRAGHRRAPPGDGGRARPPLRRSGMPDRHRSTSRRRRHVRRDPRPADAPQPPGGPAAHRHQPRPRHQDRHMHGARGWPAYTACLVLALTSRAGR
jgi:carbon-monoxide dehydrogenase medium subunit